MSFIIEFLNNIYVEYLVRLLLALTMGIVIGYDRNRKGSPAGVKTHSLVTIGSSLVMITGDFLYNKYFAGDVTRLAAQVISGVGFLGAGTIILTGKSRIRGLTTAAGLWFCACVGVAVGAGFYFGAIVASVLEIFILKRFYYYGDRQQFEIMLQIAQEFSLLELTKRLKEINGKLVQIGDGSKETFFVNGVYLIVTIEIDRKQKETQLFDLLSTVKGIISVVDIG